LRKAFKEGSSREIRRSKASTRSTGDRAPLRIRGAISVIDWYAMSGTYLFNLL
jgi:hypothetical protein